MRLAVSAQWSGTILAAAHFIMLVVVELSYMTTPTNMCGYATRGFGQENSTGLRSSLASLCLYTCTYTHIHTHVHTACISDTAKPFGYSWHRSSAVVT